VLALSGRWSIERAKDGAAVEIGYVLSSAEHGTRSCSAARRQQTPGIEVGVALRSLTPWALRAGRETFVWSVIGAAIAAPTSLRVTPAVTSHHSRMPRRSSPGRLTRPASRRSFRIGVGSGENLTRDILGGRWPTDDERLEMLAEAVDGHARLWAGEPVTPRGEHYVVRRRGSTSGRTPPPPVLVSCVGPSAALLADKIGDGRGSTCSPTRDRSSSTEQGGAGEARAGSSLLGPGRTRRTHWPSLWRTNGVPGEINKERGARPFRAGGQMSTSAGVADKASHAARGRVASRRGRAEVSRRPGRPPRLDRIYRNQIGPDQGAFSGFLHPAEREGAPRPGWGRSRVRHESADMARIEERRVDPSRPDIRRHRRRHTRAVDGHRRSDSALLQNPAHVMAGRHLGTNRWSSRCGRCPSRQSAAGDGGPPFKQQLGDASCATVNSTRGEPTPGPRSRQGSGPLRVTTLYGMCPGPRPSTLGAAGPVRAHGLADRGMRGPCLGRTDGAQGTPSFSNPGTLVQFRFVCGRRFPRRPHGSSLPWVGGWPRVSTMGEVSLTSPSA